MLMLFSNVIFAILQYYYIYYIIILCDLRNVLTFKTCSFFTQEIKKNKKNTTMTNAIYSRVWECRGKDST